MKKKWIVLLALVALLALGPVLLAVGGGYQLSWWTVDGGGSTSQGGSYALSGTAGQHDAGTSSGGPYVLSGGFWNDANYGLSGVEPLRTFLPLTLK